MNYRFHRAALAEYLDEVAFYESRLPGLGATPDLFPRIADSDLRKAGLKRFPFHVICRAEATRIVILAIAHQRRRPAYWVGRIGK